MKTIFWQCEYCGEAFTPKKTNYCSNRCRLALKAKPIPAVIDLEGEIWKSVVGYEGYYEVSNLGRVKRNAKKIYSEERICWVHKKERIVDQTIRTYKFVHLIVHGRKTKLIRTHRLVALAFIPNPENKPEVNHIDGNKLNNNLENLEWVTRSENAIHAYSNGLIPKGENSHKTKITNEQALDIFKRAHIGEKHRTIANDYNISKSVVTDIKRQKSWKHITK
jgi:hypothetical protein